jgi:hypothetical protein
MSHLMLFLGPWPPGGGGWQSTEHATCRQGDSLGWLHRSGVATVLQSTPATVLFFMQVPLSNPFPSPEPNIGRSVTKGSDPEALSKS